MIYFTSDEHYYHKNIIDYSDRPFSSLDEMHEVLIQNHNKVVKPTDTVYHLGDFSFDTNINTVFEHISRLQGLNIFLKGSHDYWQRDFSRKFKTKFHEILDIKCGDNYIVLCHYCMLTWPRSHYGSWHLFGHHHGQFTGNVGKSYDVGVDSNGYKPVSIDELVEIMKTRPDNINLLKR